MSRQEQPQRTASGRQPRLESVDSARDFETALAELRIAVETAYAEELDDWPAQVAAAIRAVLEFAADEPVAAQVLTVESLAQGSDHFARHRRPVDHLARLLAAGRNVHPEGDVLPSLLEDALAGGIFMLVVQRLEAGDVGALTALAPDAIEFALTPYIGRDKARDVAAAGSPERDSNS
jgi:hypothetical protein